MTVQVIEVLETIIFEYLGKSRLKFFLKCFSVTPITDKRINTKLQ